MLFVMSAFVALNGFPGQDVRDPIGTLLVQQRQAPVTVPAHPVRESGRTARSGGGTAHQRHTAVTRAHAPSASTGPVVRRTPSKAPATTQAPAAGSGGTNQSSSPALPDTPQLPSDTPSLPQPTLPQVPGVSVPEVQAPSSSQLPVDTGSVTGILGGQ
jgi:hypothetical protein